MRILIMTDRTFARCERAMIDRLELGLVNEGMQIVRAVPSDMTHAGDLSLVESAVPFTTGSMLATRRLRVGQFASVLHRRFGSEPVDAMHVFGGGLWGFAGLASRMLRIPLLLEVWRLGLVPRARALAMREPGPVLLMSPDEMIERTLRQDAQGMRARLCPWGVRVPSQPLRIMREERTRSVVIAGPGRDIGRMVAAFTAAARIARQRGDLFLFVDAGAARRAGLWKLGARLGIRDRMSLIDELEARRDLALRVDLLVYPDHRGEQRTLLLDAMALGVPIVASEDAGMSSLRHGRTAELVTGASAELWETAMRRLIDDPTAARRLGASAREFVREHRKSSVQIATVLDAYEQLTAERSAPTRAAS